MGQQKIFKTIWCGVSLIIRIRKNKITIEPEQQHGHEFGSKIKIPPRPFKRKG